MDFKNKTVLITGANGGLGEAFVHQIRNEGAKKIYCTARDVKKLEKFNFSNVEFLQMDITNISEIQKINDTIENIDILINNAGVNSGKRVFDKERMDFDVNLFGTLNSCQILKNKINKNGAIVNISSILALSNLPIIGLYCASKSALHSITQALRAELKLVNIEVYEVLPGPIDTPLTAGQEMPKANPRDVVNEVIENMKNGKYEIFPDEFSQNIYQALQENSKNIEEEFSHSVQ